MPRPAPARSRSIVEHIPAGGRLASLLATARRLDAVDRVLPAVLGLGEAAGLRALRITPTTLTLGTDSPGRVYRLRYARTALLTALRALPGLEGLERVELRTLAGPPAPPSGGGVAPGRGGSATARGSAGRPPDAVALRAAAGDCVDPRLRAVLERLAGHARNAREL